jgi:glutathione-regulated potassium-efflux system ancillary protein KefC
MEHVWFSAALWLVLALVATMLSIWFRISTALSEIVVGTVAQLIIGALIGTEVLGAKSAWVGFLAGTGAIVLTFLAGAELDPGIFRTKWKEATVVGLVGFFSPFLGAAAVAHFLLKWSVPASWLAGVALSTTSVAVVYAVMLEFGLNRTDFGKGILAACFVNDLGTVIALGLIFAPFTMRTLIFVGASIVVFAALPFVTPWFFEKYGGRVSELETKYILFLLFGMGGLAAWAGSEAVLPAYIIGMVLAGTVGKDHILVRRLRTLTFGLLTPFYFIRAGSLVSVPALIAMPLAFLALLAAKLVTKLLPLIPTVRAFNHVGHQGLYYSFMMSTGLTFGTIAALFGLNHQIIGDAQYSYLVATVIASAVVPTAIANAYFMPKHLLPKPEPAVHSTPALIEDAGPGGR